MERLYTLRHAERLRFRKRQGVSLAELAGVMMIMIPVAFMVIFAAIEVSHACVIHGSLSSAAHTAARNLAIAYWKNSDVANSPDLQDALVLQHVRITNIVNDSRQFTNVIFDTAADPPYVAVTVTYTGGTYGLPKFPGMDVLNLGSISLSASASQALD